MRKFGKLVIAALLCTVEAATADPVSIASTTIRYTFAGSPNTIAGSWSAGPIDVGAASVSSFLVEFKPYDSTFGAPQSVTFVSTFLGQSVGLHFCNPLSATCVGEPTPGASMMVTVDNAPGDGAWAFLNRLLFDRFDTTLHGNGGASFTSGGLSATLMGQVEVTAFGEGTPLSEPASILLLPLAIVATLAVKRNRSRRGS